MAGRRSERARIPVAQSGILGCRLALDCHAFMGRMASRDSLDVTLLQRGCLVQSRPGACPAIRTGTTARSPTATERASDVILSVPLARIPGKVFDWPKLNEVTRVASLRGVHVQEHRRVRRALGLLQIVRDDGDRVFLGWKIPSDLSENH